MRSILTVALIVNTLWGVAAQQALLGTVIDRQSGDPLSGAQLHLEGQDMVTTSGADGSFRLSGLPEGHHVLIITILGYNALKLPLDLGSGFLELGRIFLEREPPEVQTDPFISLTEEDAWEDEGILPTYSLLHAGRDIFLKRAAFDFSQAFFRVRGYDSRDTGVLVNGLLMNSLLDGRPQWNHWGGLNDVMRNQELFYGLQPSDYGFGGLLGNIQISTRPSQLRPGWHISASHSNRTYNGRLMATLVSASDVRGWAYALSGSRRWAREGYINGTLYDAWSVFGSLEYQFNEASSVTFTALLASNRRGRSAAISEEVKQLAGSRYNPNWGWQSGEKRNSRERLIREPLFQLNYRFEGTKSRLLLGMAYQTGIQSRSRLGYYHAPNPDPTYYQYLPSYLINNPGGANFISAGMAEAAFHQDPQVNWSALYRANTNEENRGMAAYLHYDDVLENRQLQLQLLANLDLGRHLRLDTGMRYRSLHNNSFARIRDLLGAAYHSDTDPFSETINDVDGPIMKQEGAVFGYWYQALAGTLEPFIQLRYTTDTWWGFGAMHYLNSRYQRRGIFKNERYPEHSQGTGTPVAFSDIGFKGGLQYHLGGRHWWSLYGTIGHRPPVIQHTYINPREYDAVVPNLKSEQLSSLEFRYDMRWPGLLGRLGLFYTRIMNQTNIRFFYVDSGLGSDFVQEVTTGLDQLNLGFELGMEYELTSNLKASVAASLGRYRYASDPLVTINFDTAGAADNLINLVGTEALGPATLKGEALPAGPQTALSIGLEYRDPTYWWVGVTGNYLAGSYTSPSALARTQSFRLDPESGEPFPQATPRDRQKLLFRKPLEDLYLLNLTGGKSWLHKGLYMSVFVSINNVFDTIFRTGGYEQSRNGNYGQWVQDHLSGSPSFGTKYWYGYGRTFFLNLAVGF